MTCRHDPPQRRRCGLAVARARAGSATAALWRLALLITLTCGAVTLAGSSLWCWPCPSRAGSSTRRFWCVLARHRLHRLCYEARLHTRAGRLPLVLWTRPTKVGERARVLCRAGICADDFAAHAGELRRSLLRPRSAGHPQPPLVPAGDHRHHPPRHPRGQPQRRHPRCTALARPASHPGHPKAGPHPGATPTPGSQPPDPRDGSATRGRISRGPARSPSPPNGGHRHDRNHSRHRPPCRCSRCPCSAPSTWASTRTARHVHVDLAERNMLLGGEPGGGKSTALNLIVAHGALSGDCRLILIDGKQVELGPLAALRRPVHRPVHRPTPLDLHAPACQEHHERPVRAAPRRRAAQDHPASRGSRSTSSSSTSTPTSPPPSAPRPSRDEFSALHPRPGRPRTGGRGHRHPGHPAALASGHRPVACGTCSATGGRSAAPPTPPPTPCSATAGPAEGYTAATIDPLARGVSWLLSETGIPRRIKTAYLTDRHIKPTWPPTPPSSAGRTRHESS